MKSPSHSKPSKSASRLRRRITLSGDIAAGLRAKILGGTLVPGQRLPTHVMIEKQFRSTPPTVAKALSALRREGYIRSDGRRGMFVAKRPPHESHFALVAPHDPADTSTLWSRFYATLVNEAPAVARATRCKIIPFYGLDDGPRAADYARLTQWCNEGSLAGIIFASHPHRLMGTPILEKPGIPRVAAMSMQQFPGVPAVSLEGSFISKALAWLAERGRRRLAVLMQADELRRRNLARQAAGYGLELRPAWQLPMTQHLVEAGGAYVRLLMTAAESNRPDALLVGDDNYVESALEGLRTTGARLGRDLDMVAHCNFPWAGALPPQVKKLGYSAHEVLETCLRLLDRQRDGVAVPAVTRIEAKFEEELAGGMPNSESFRESPKNFGDADLSSVALAKGECRFLRATLFSDQSPVKPHHQ